MDKRSSKQNYRLNNKISNSFAAVDSQEKRKRKRKIKNDIVSYSIYQSTKLQYNNIFCNIHHIFIDFIKWLSSEA